MVAVTKDATLAPVGAPVSTTTSWLKPVAATGVRAAETIAGADAAATATRSAAFVAPARRNFILQLLSLRGRDISPRVCTPSSEFCCLFERRLAEVQSL